MSKPKCCIGLDGERKTCDYHRGYYQGYKAGRRGLLKLAKRCIECGGELDPGSDTLCKMHLERQRAAQQRYAERKADD